MLLTNHKNKNYLQVFLITAICMLFILSLGIKSAFATPPQPTDVPAFYSMINRFDPESANGKFDEPKSMAIDSHGNIYVVDRDNYRIQKFSSSGTYITKWGGVEGSGDGEFDSPRGIGIDSSDNVYVVDPGRDDIQKFDSSGNFISKFGSWGSGNGEFDSPYDIDFDSAGNIFVADDGNCRIQKFDSDGTYNSQFGDCGSGDGELDDPRGLVIDSTDNILVTDYGNSRVQKFDSSGAYVSQFGGSYGSGDGEFASHYGIDVDSSGNIYVADRGNNRIQKFNNSGVFVAKWGANGGDGTSGESDGEFDSPNDVKVDSSGNVYVVDEDNDRIQKFDSNGTYISQFGGFGNLEIGPSNDNGKFNAPRDMAQDSHGNIYVADGTNNRIQKFDKNGNFIAKWGANGGDGTNGTGNGEFDFPEAIVIDSSDNVYVGEANNYRVQKFDSDGNFIAKWGANGGNGSSGSGDGEFASIRGLAIASDGNLLVVDNGNYRVQKINSTTGTFMSKFGSAGTGDGQFDTPAGITVDVDGNIYVADMYNYRIQKFTSTGTFITKWGQYGTGNGEFAGVSAVDVDNLGNVYALDYDNNRVQKFDTDGNYLAQWGGSGTGDSQFDNPEGLQVSADGNTVMVADSDNQRIQIFKYGPDEVTPPTSNTASLTNAETGKALTLTTPTGTVLTCNSTNKESVQEKQDATFDYPAGLVNFCFSTSSTNNQITLTFVADLAPTDVIARKYNPATKEYSTIPNAQITSTTVSGQPALQLIYTLVDNGPLDLDPVTGQITDPVGLAVTTNNAGISTPNTGVAKTNKTLPILILSAGSVILVASSAYIALKRNTKI